MQPAYDYTWSDESDREEEPMLVRLARLEAKASARTQTRETAQSSGTSVGNVDLRSIVPPPATPEVMVKFNTKV